MTLPAELDRRELVQRVSATQLRIIEQHHWAAPLEDLIRHALTEDLHARRASNLSDTSAATLSIDIHEFSVDRTCAVRLQVSWRLQPSAQRAFSARTPPETRDAALTGRNLVELPPSSRGECPIESVPMRMSEALARLSDRILEGTAPPDTRSPPATNNSAPSEP